MDLCVECGKVVMHEDLAEKEDPLLVLIIILSQISLLYMSYESNALKVKIVKDAQRLSAALRCHGVKKLI